MGPDMDEKVKIAAFNGTGFHNWKFRVETVLDSYDLVDCLNREAAEIEEWQEAADDTAEQKAEKKKKIDERIVKQKKCKSLIIQAIADSQLELVKDCDTPKKIWTTLKNVFERRGIAGQILIRKQLLTLKFEEGAGGGLPEHLLKFDRLIRELKESGAAVEDSDAICHLLLTLPPSFDSVVTAIETLPGGVTMDFVKKRLLDVDMKKRGLKTVDSGASEGAAMASKQGRRKPKCFQCGKRGHLREDCRVQVKSEAVENEQKTNDKSEVKSSNQKANAGVQRDHPEVAFVASIADVEFVDMVWYLDSGATDHMLKDSSFFSVMRRLERPAEVVVANGQKLIAEYCGDVILYAEISGKKKAYEIRNVLYLPGLSCNLFSVKRVTRTGLQVSFAGDKAEITRDGVVMAEGRFKDKLYVLNVFCKRSDMGTAMLTGKVSRKAMVWHQRFGHAGCDSLRELVSHDMVEGLDLQIDDDAVMCEPCLLGKFVKLPYPPTTESRSSRPLELVHSDVSGPYTPQTWDDKRFFVTFIDDYSHFTVLFLLSTKAGVMKCFREYEALVIARFGTKIAKLRTDNGGEYTSEEMRSFCKEKGIEMEFTVPYTPQLNGVSERMNRTIMERARALLVESGFGKEMWGEAVFAVTYIINRCPTSAVKDHKTPYELWTGRKPDVSRLRIFGSSAYTYIPKEHRSKLDPKSKKLFMVGYMTNGYRLWDAEKQQVVSGRDVVFDEGSLFGSTRPREVALPEKETLVELDCQSLVEKHAAVPEVQEDRDGASSSDDEPVPGPAAPPVRRSGRQRREPVWFDCYEMASGLAMCAENFVEDLPTTVEGLRQRADWPRWEEAIAEEKQALEKNKTWISTSPPEGRSVIDSKRVFRIKNQEAGGGTRYKARLVARGFSQSKGLDYDDNQACIQVTEDDKPTKRLKHMDVNLHFVRDEIQRGAVCLPTEDQVADVMTKPLPRGQFQKLRESLGLTA